MSTQSSIVETTQASGAEGVLLKTVTLSPEQVRSFHDAQKCFDELERLLLEAIVPALGGRGHPVTFEMNDLIEQVRFGTGMFCYRQRLEMGLVQRERPL